MLTCWEPVSPATLRRKIMLPLPYCGTPPSPGELLARFNLDPVLITTLVVLASAHVYGIPGSNRRGRAYAASGWLVAALALVSPLCALSVSLFSARIAQHMILVLVAAPLIALGWPRQSYSVTTWPLWAASTAFMISLWCWHMPTPYAATFTSTAVYWTMHVTLFGSSVALWSELIHHPPRRTALVLSAGLLSSMQMGLLGAVLALARRPLFYPHFATTQAWGLTALQDQQLGGTLMWVPGILLFLWVSIRSLRRLWNTLEGMSRNESDPARLS
ncbi:MAG TPA: cytochrome c oxidase assembly protein [Bryobacteraceae bacterium]|nr:cytochrome c oxidase assembly protein [Bryobacteraceae bacterium]